MIEPIGILRTPMFDKAAAGLLNATEIDELEDYLSANPEAGAIVRGTGGVRKLRWAAKGRGKSGGVRVIYYYHNASVPLALVTVYAKSR